MITRLLFHRILVAVSTLLAVSVAVFLATEILPGSAVDAVLGQSATPEAIAALRAKLHLDQPAILRYFIWLRSLALGDLGTSLVNGRPVGELIASRLPNSLMLAALTTAFCVPVGLFLGVTSAVRRDSAYDRATSIVTLAIISVPEFFVATLAVLIFAVQLRWLPALSLGADTGSLAGFFRTYTLPVLALSGIIIAQMMRMTRAALIDVIRQPYIEMARLKGVRGRAIVLRHALPNAVGPIANAVALSLSHVLGGALIIETVFNYPGLARLLVDAVSTRDMPLLQACTMLFCAVYLGLVTAADIAGILTNPRLRFQ